MNQPEFASVAITITGLAGIAYSDDKRTSGGWYVVRELDGRVEYE